MVNSMKFTIHVQQGSYIGRCNFSGFLDGETLFCRVIDP